jgi:hypothetical protein
MNDFVYAREQTKTPSLRLGGHCGVGFRTQCARWRLGCSCGLTWNSTPREGEVLGWERVAEQYWHYVRPLNGLPNSSTMFPSTFEKNMQVLFPI